MTWTATQVCDAILLLLLKDHTPVETFITSLNCAISVVNSMRMLREIVRGMNRLQWMSTCVGRVIITSKGWVDRILVSRSVSRPLNTESVHSLLVIKDVRHVTKRGQGLTLSLSRCLIGIAYLDEILSALSH